MMQRGLVLLIIYQLAINTGFTQVQEQSFFYNPVIAGFYPDPSICRVGNDYYLVNSTFTYFPGIPIFHSTDLVHWQQIGHALDRVEQFDLNGLDVSEGIYASTIRYNNNTYYITSTVVGKQGNFLITATYPAGPWSDPIWLPEIVGIDPSLFFDDDGKTYIIYNSNAPNNEPLYSGHRTIRMYELDIVSIQVKGDEIILINGGTNIDEQPVWIEGPHIFKKDNYYYLIAAEGGTGSRHSEVVFRAKNVTGPYIPYNNNPILSQRELNPTRKYAITSTGHADFVQTQAGEWWAVFLGCRPYEPYLKGFYNTGRETFMAPVEWKNGWPVVNTQEEEIKYIYPLPNLPMNNIEYMPLNGNFNHTDNFNKNKLAFQWIFLRTPSSKWYNLQSHTGKLEVELLPVICTENGNPAFIARRQQHAFCTAETSMEFMPQAENEFAGLVAFQNESCFYAIGKTIYEGDTVVGLFQSGIAPSYTKIYRVKDEVFAPSNNSIYQSHRYGQNIQYVLPVETGISCLLTLKFAETFWKKPGARIFNVFINEQKVLDKFDIIKVAGASFTALDTSFVLVPDSSVINIRFETILNYASINGISIEQNGVKKIINCGEKDEPFLFIEKIDKPLKTIALSKLKQEETKLPLFLKIEAKGRLYSFYYTTDTTQWRLIAGNIDGTLLSTKVAGGFVGTTLGMYATSHGRSSSNVVLFDWFTYAGNDPVYNDTIYVNNTFRKNQNNRND